MGFMSKLLLYIVTDAHLWQLGSSSSVRPPSGCPSRVIKLAHINGVTLSAGGTKTKGGGREWNEHTRAKQGIPTGKEGFIQGGT